MHGTNITFKLLELQNHWNNYDRNVIGFSMWLVETYSGSHSWKKTPGYIYISSYSDYSIKW